MRSYLSSATAPLLDQGNLGLVLYLWTPESQNAWLAGFLRPAAHELRESQDLRWLWFDRFDARGPHLFACAAPFEGRLPALRAGLADALEAAWNEQKPKDMTGSLDRQEAWKRHLACRGRAQNEIDKRSGLGEPGTLVSFIHPERCYPFSLTCGLPGEAEIWDLWDQLIFWILDCLAAAEGRVPTSAAAHWLASLDLELGAANVDRARYWEYHASTLAPGRTAAPGGRQPAPLGDRTVTTCRRIWRNIRDAGPIWPPVRQLVKTIFLDPTLSPESKRAILREIVHCTLKQLGLPVRQEFPLIHFAWSGARSSEGGGQ